jgi:hypothetical protein
MNTVTEKVKVWGVHDEFPEPNLGKFLDELDHVYYSIPAELRASAIIDFDPYYDCAGDAYAQVRITYDRPATPEDIALWTADARKNWMDQLEEARERVAYCTAQLDTLPAAA